MAALLVGIAVMGILMSAAMPAWKTLVQREREEELVFRGEQYARAVGLFQRKFAGAFPPSVEMLVQQKFLRKAYKDPVTGGEFQVLYQSTAMAVPGQGRGPAAGQPGFGASASSRPGQVEQAPGLAPAATGPGPGLSGGSGATAGPRGGIVGVTSKSPKASLRLYKGRSKYNEWQFVYTQASSQIGVPGQPSPGMPGGFPGSARPGGVPGSGRPGGMSPTYPPGGGPPPRRP
jgi:type II secretory pathway pseudopilin PulG